VASVYRTVDALAERLGRSKRVYRPTLASTVVSGLFGLVLVCYALAALEATVSDEAAFAPAALFWIFVFGVAGAGLLAHALRSRGLSFELREHGFVHRAGRVETVARWDELSEVRATLSLRHNSRSGRFGYVVSLAGGRKVELPHALEGIDDIRARLDEETVRTLLPRAIADVEAGRAVAFGPFVATGEGLAFGGEALPWREVTGATTVRGVLAVGDKAKVTLLPKRDGVLAWAKAQYVDVPNGALLVALVDHFKGGR
jgi:hypothetical protein